MGAGGGLLPAPKAQCEVDDNAQGEAAGVEEGAAAGGAVSLDNPSLPPPLEGAGSTVTAVAPGSIIACLPIQRESKILVL